MHGLIIKGIAGFYYVKCGDTVYECKARGIFKKRGISPTVGDRVDISAVDDEKGVIEDIMPRRNLFIRPPIANIDCFIVVMAASHPEPNFPVIDKFLVMADVNNTDAVLVVNKTDLASEDKLRQIREIYGNICDVVFMNAREGRGISDLAERISGKTAAFAGPSGVGKSTILNALLPDVNVRTGSVSDKTRRGKNTTRHVEIFEAEGGGMIYDTPGFTSFDIIETGEEELDLHFPEIAVYKGQCYFDNCRHLKEPSCAVRKALEDGKIHPMRYKSYVSLIQAMRENRKY